MKRVLFLAIAGGLLSVANVYALDRGASMIDSLGADFATWDNGDAVEVTLWGETALDTPGREWAFVIGGGIGTISPDSFADVDFWHAGAGIKYYATALTSLSLIGHYTSFDLGGDPNSVAGTVTCKQRLIAPEEAISPYVLAAGTFRSSDWDYDSPETDNFTELEARIGIGADFMLTDSLAVTIDSSYSLANEFSGGGGSPEFWTVGIAFKGFWE